MTHVHFKWHTSFNIVIFLFGWNQNNDYISNFKNQKKLKYISHSIEIKQNKTWFLAYFFAFLPSPTHNDWGYPIQTKPKINCQILTLNNSEKTNFSTSLSSSKQRRRFEFKNVKGHHHHHHNLYSKVMTSLSLDVILPIFFHSNK